MMSNTAISDALMQAGIDTDASRLAVTANDILARFGISPMMARGEFAAVLSKDERLLLAAAEYILNHRAADMRGESLIGRGQGQPAHESHRPGASTDQSVGSEGDHVDVAPASWHMSSSLPHKADRESQNESASAMGVLPSRSAPSHDGRGQRFCVAQVGFASSVVKPAPADPTPWRPKDIVRTPPKPPRGIAAIASIQHVVARSVIDTYKVRGNVAIGDLAWSEAQAMVHLNEREAQVLRHVTNHVANARPGDIIRNIVKAEVVEEAIKLATERNYVLAG